jgi:superfamily II DNA or RNA helicase
MEQRQYQQQAIAFLAKSKRGIVQAPAGAGKTHIAASALALCLLKRRGVADVEIMVNTREQVEQMQSACDRFPVIKEKAHLQIYCAAGAPMGSKPDLLIVDECHRAGADGWSAKIRQTESARWGLSATPFTGDADRNGLVRHLFGSNVHCIERAALVEDGHLAKAKVVWHDVQSAQASEAIEQLSDELIASRRRKMAWMFRSQEGERKQTSQCKWQAAQKLGIWENPDRDAHIELIARQSMEAGNHTIVLIGSIEHGKRLAAAIEGAELVYSKMGAKKRADVIARFRDGSLKCMIGTSAIEEGFDAPVANVIIMAGCGRSERKAIQSTGRVLRPHDGKACGIIHDFRDGFHPMLQRQSQARARIYRQLNYY